MSPVQPIEVEPDWTWDPDKPVHIVTLTDEEAAYATGIPKTLPLPRDRWSPFGGWGGDDLIIHPPPPDPRPVSVLAVASLVATRPVPKPKALLATVGWSGWETYIHDLDDPYNAGVSDFRQEYQAFPPPGPRPGDYVNISDSGNSANDGRFQVIAVGPDGVHLTPGNTVVSMGCVVPAYRQVPVHINCTIIEPNQPELEPPRKPLEGWNGWPLGEPESE